MGRRFFIRSTDNIETSLDKTTAHLGSSRTVTEKSLMEKSISEEGL